MVVVIGILALLGGMLLNILNPFGQFQKANDSRRKSDLAQVSRALEAYYQDNGRYPEADSSYHIKRLDGTPVIWGQQWVPYMTLVPKDPGSSSYIYVTNEARQSYYLYASLERGSQDSQVCTGVSNKCANVPLGVKCGGESYVCNYGLTSPNVSP